MELNENNVAVGTKVVINDKIGHHARRFTKGKVYEVLAVDDIRKRVKVIADDGLVSSLYMRRFDIFEENRVKYWVCIKGSSSVEEGRHYLVENTLRNRNLLLINGRWHSVNRFKLVELPEQAAPKKEDKPAPPPPKSLAKLLKEEQDKIGRIVTCSYAIMDDKGVVKYQVNDICHARIRPLSFPGTLTGVSLMVEAHAKKIRVDSSPEEEALYLRAIDYILHRSPWSSIYINKDFKNNFGCVDLDVDRGVNAVACAAIALRTCSEFASNNKVFCALVEAGVNEHVAYIIAHSCMNKGVGNNSGGHHVFSGACTLKSILSFFKTGKFIDEGATYRENKEGYVVISSQLVEDIDGERKDEKLGYWLFGMVDKLPTIDKVQKWGSVTYTWKVPNNLIPLANQLEKEFNNV